MATASKPPPPASTPKSTDSAVLNVCEIFISIQGESTQAGRLCSFVRLFGCNLRCVWCDTGYACAGAMKTMGVDEVAAEVEKHYADGCVSGAGRLVEITGGEPLLQPETVTLCERFSALGYEVMVETNGSLDISAFPKGIRRVVDVKCPGSGAGGSFLTDNLNYIRADDEVKFVAASIDDAVWAKEFCDQYGLIGRCAVIFSPASPALPYSALAEWITKNRLTGIRLGVQLHKVVWGDKRGV